jgi:hypothetical protein
MNQQTIQDKLKIQMKKWEAEITRLEAKADSLGSQAKAQFRELIGEARARWYDAEAALREFELVSEDERETMQAQVKQLLDNAENALARAAEAAGESLGWAEGMAEARADNSEGWAEGFGKRGPDSKGWAEGLAEELQDNSVGWAEGLAEERES